MSRGDDGRAVEFVGPERVDVVAIDDRVPAPDEMVVEAAVSAISAGSELLAYRGDRDRIPVADAPAATELTATVHGDGVARLPYTGALE